MTAKEAMAAAIERVQNGVEISLPLSPNETATSRAILAALRAAGWAVVPRVPTEVMLQAGYDWQVSDWPKDWGDDGTTPELYTAQKIWPAMLAAAEGDGG